MNKLLGNCYVFVAHSGAEFGVLSANATGTHVQDAASKIHDSIFGAGTNDKFDGPVRVIPVYMEL